ncbi:MAG TPA: diguanylate cyclase [Clostridiales bacterium]|nr:diguanylate cyclase [Clostridiales bacterium]
MNLIKDLQSKPAVLLTLVVILISICIIVVVLILLYRLENEKRVARAALELKRITNSIRAGLVHFILEDHCRILYASNGFYEILGYDKAAAKAGNKTSLYDFIDPQDVTFVQDIEQQLGNETIRREVRMLTRDNNLLYFLMNGNSTLGKDGRHTLSVVFVDISEMKCMQELILLEGERYRIATELSNDILFEYHIRTDKMVHADKIGELFGISPTIPDFRKNCEERRGYIHPDDWGIFLEFCQSIASGSSIIESQYRMKNRLGEFIWCQIMGKTIYDDNKNPVRVIGKIVNVDSQKRELEALEFKATRDPLTGVYNKEVTIKKIDKFISGNKDRTHMLMLVDLDDFKRINDTYGHLQGDKVLTYVITRIKEVFSEGEIIGRIGGDEFVVFAGNITNVEEVLDKAAILKQALDLVYRNGPTSIKISGSIGVAIYPEAGIHYEQLMEHADQALYQVKERGKNDFMLYSPTAN